MVICHYLSRNSRSITQQEKNQDHKFNIADMKQAPECGQKTETIKQVGSSGTELSQIGLYQLMSHTATSIAERHRGAKQNGSSVDRNKAKFVSQRKWPTDESVVLTGEICCLDVDGLIPIYEPKKDPCTRSKSYPTDKSSNPWKWTPAHRINQRLLPRRPRINEEQPKVRPPIKKLMHPGARLKKNMEKSFSVEPALESVARQRYLEYQGLSTCQPHELPPLAQRTPVAASRSLGHNGSVPQNGQREKFISISDFPKSSDCKDIFLRANLGPLRAQVSQVEKEEFQHWKRRFYEETKKALGKREETLTSQKDHRGKYFKSCIPGEVDMHHASCEMSFQVDKTQHSIQNTETLPALTGKYTFTAVQPIGLDADRTCVSPSQSAKQTNEELSSSSTGEEPVVSFPNVIGNAEERQKVEQLSTFEEENISNPEGTNTSEVTIQSAELQREDKSEVGRRDHSFTNNETASKPIQTHSQKHQTGILNNYQENQCQQDENLQSASHPVTSRGRAIPDGVDLWLIKKVNKWRYLFQASRRQQVFESGEQRQADRGCASNGASKDQEMRRPTVECEVQTQAIKMPHRSPNGEQIGNITSLRKEKKSSTYENDSTLEGQQSTIHHEGKGNDEEGQLKEEDHIDRITFTVGKKISCLRKNAFPLQVKHPCTSFEGNDGEEGTTLPATSLHNRNAKQSLEVISVDDSSCLVDTNEEDASEYKRQVSLIEHMQTGANRHSSRTRSRREGTSYAPFSTDIHADDVNKETRTFSHGHKDILDNGKKENARIQLKNRSSMIRTRRKGTCNGTISPEQERFLRVIRKRF